MEPFDIDIVAVGPRLVVIDPGDGRPLHRKNAHGSLAVATALSVHCLATSCIAEFGTEDQRERWLSRMSEGRPVGAFALSETHAGSNPVRG